MPDNVVTLAFYKGRGQTYWHRVQDTAIRVATGGPYSHVELIMGSALHGDLALCLSSSGRDGGVRAKRIQLRTESWDLVELNVGSSRPDQFVLKRIGASYDYRGILLSHVLGLGGHSENKWFCSEICAAAIGLPSPHLISPNRLYQFAAWRRSR